MQFIDRSCAEHFEPLPMPLPMCPVANLPFREAQLEEVRLAGAARTNLYIYDDAWVCAKALQGLVTAAEAPCVLTAADGRSLAFIGHSPQEPTAVRIQDDDSFVVDYVWDLLRVNALLLPRMAGMPGPGQISPKATVVGTLSLGEGSVLLPGVYVEGDVIIGRNCRIGPNAYLRGPLAIGDNCRVGQGVEIKNTIVMTGAAFSHLNYVGDSIIGPHTNFGGGTITANLRHDDGNVRSAVGGKLVDSGRRKLGTITGEHVHIGINTSIYPGRKFWPYTTSLPGEAVTRDKRPE